MTPGIRHLSLFSTSRYIILSEVLRCTYSPQDNPARVGTYTTRCRALHRIREDRRPFGLPVQPIESQILYVCTCYQT